MNELSTYARCFNFGMEFLMALPDWLEQPHQYREEHYEALARSIQYTIENYLEELPDAQP